MEKKHLFGAWLRRRAALIVLLGLIGIIYTGIGLLYSVTGEALLYAGVLTAAAACCFGAVDYSCYCRRHRTLAALQEEVTYSLAHLPRTSALIEQDYQQLLHILFEEKRSAASRTDAEMTRMIEYYTLWVHQIKTPISAMHLLLQSEHPSPDDLSAELFKIEQYVEMVLSYLRLGSNTGDFVIRVCPLAPIIRQSVRKFSRIFITKKISLHYTPCEISVLSDEKWLGFVLEQVISNALKYTREGSITIAVQGTKLTVSDTGIGIAPEDLPRIFDNGYTGYNGRADRKATGIGLHLCREICQKLGHTIAVDSVVGEGTTVTLDLAREPLEVND